VGDGTDEKCTEGPQAFVHEEQAQHAAEEFRRLGVFGDWEHPYLTMAPAYEGVIVREFGRLVGRGLVYKGLKPVHWCMYCKTALAQAEVEYEDQRTPSVYVRLPLVSPLPGAPEAPRPSLVVWTTTPWTLPANLAVAVNPREAYVALAVGEETLVVADKLADEVLKIGRLGPARRVATFPGESLAGLEYRHPWLDRRCPARARSTHRRLTGVMHS